MSVTPIKELLDKPLHVIPQHPTLENYRLALFGDTGQGGSRVATTTRKIAAGLRNSFEVGVMVTLVGLVIGSLAGYAYARFERMRLLQGTIQALMITRMMSLVPSQIRFWLPAGNSRSPTNVRTRCPVTS